MSKRVVLVSMNGNQVVSDEHVEEAKKVIEGKF
jgi:hypothetical protein